MMKIRAAEWNAANAATGKPYLQVPGTGNPPANANKYLTVINMNIEREETNDDGDAVTVAPITFEAFEGIWIYYDPDILELDDIDLRTSEIPFRIYKRDFPYSQIFLTPEKRFFLQLAVTQEKIEPGKPGRVQIAGLTIAKTYGYRLIDDGRTLEDFKSDYPFVGLRRDGIFSPYQDSPVSARLLGRKILATMGTTEAQQRERIPDEIFFSYGFIILPIHLSR
jgi:hypothetical protein